jgi:hypothetical protein
MRKRRERAVLWRRHRNRRKRRGSPADLVAIRVT